MVRQAIFFMCVMCFCVFNATARHSNSMATKILDLQEIVDLLDVDSSDDFFNDFTESEEEAVGSLSSAELGRIFQREVMDELNLRDDSEESSSSEYALSSSSSEYALSSSPDESSSSSEYALSSSSDESSSEDQSALEWMSKLLNLNPQEIEVMHELNVDDSDEYALSSSSQDDEYDLSSSSSEDELELYSLSSSSEDETALSSRLLPASYRIPATDRSSEDEYLLSSWDRNFLKVNNLLIGEKRSGDDNEYEHDEVAIGLIGKGIDWSYVPKYTETAPFQLEDGMDLGSQTCDKLQKCQALCDADTRCQFIAFGTDTRRDAGTRQSSCKLLAHGTSPQRYILLHGDVECESADTSLGHSGSAEECEKKARSVGAKFFVWRAGGHCYQELTDTAICEEKWDNDDYDFYKVIQYTDLSRFGDYKFFEKPNFTQSCLKGVYYINGDEETGGADATSRAQCQRLCQANFMCDFWEYGKVKKDDKDKCQFRRNSGGGAVTAGTGASKTPHSMSAGTKMCGVASMGGLPAHCKLESTDSDFKCGECRDFSQCTFAADLEYLITEESRLTIENPKTMMLLANTGVATGYPIHAQSMQVDLDGKLCVKPADEAICYFKPPPGPGAKPFHPYFRQFAIQTVDPFPVPDFKFKKKGRPLKGSSPCGGGELIGLNTDVKPICDGDQVLIEAIQFLGKRHNIFRSKKWLVDSKTSYYLSLKDDDGYVYQTKDPNPDTWYIQFLEQEDGVLITGREFLILNARKDCYLKMKCTGKTQCVLNDRKDCYDHECLKPTKFQWDDDGMKRTTDDLGNQPPIMCEKMNLEDPSLFIWRYAVRPELVENSGPANNVSTWWENDLKKLHPISFTGSVLMNDWESLKAANNQTGNEWATLDFVQFLSYPFELAGLGRFVEREVESRMWMGMPYQQRHAFNIDYPRFVTNEMMQDLKVAANKKTYNELANIQMGISLKEQVEADNAMSDDDLECKYDKEKLMQKQQKIWNTPWGKEEKRKITDRVLYQNFPKWESYREPDNALKNLKLLTAFVSSPYFQKFYYAVVNEKDRDSIVKHLYGVAQSLSSFVPSNPKEQETCEHNSDSGNCLFVAFVKAQTTGLATGQVMYKPDEIIRNAVNGGTKGVAEAMQKICSWITNGTKNEEHTFRRLLKGETMLSKSKGGGGGGGAKGGKAGGASGGADDEDKNKGARFEKKAFDASGKGMNRGVEIADMMKNFADYNNQGFEHLAKIEFPDLDDDIKSADERVKDQKKRSLLLKIERGSNTPKITRMQRFKSKTLELIDLNQRLDGSISLSPLEPADAAADNVGEAKLTNKGKAAWAMGSMKTLLAVYFLCAKSWGEMNWNDRVQWFSTLADTIGEVNGILTSAPATVLGANLKGIAKDLGANLKGTLSSAATTIKKQAFAKKIAELGGKIGDFLSEIGGKIMKKMAKIGTSAGGQLMNKGANYIANAGLKVVQYASKVVGPLVKAFGLVAQFIGIAYGIYSAITALQSGDKIGFLVEAVGTVGSMIALGLTIMAGSAASGPGIIAGAAVFALTLVLSILRATIWAPVTGQELMCKLFVEMGLTRKEIQYTQQVYHKGRRELQMIPILELPAPDWVDEEGHRNAENDEIITSEMFLLPPQ